MRPHVRLVAVLAGCAALLDVNGAMGAQYSYNPAPSQYERCANIARQKSGYGGSSYQGYGGAGGAAAGAIAGSWVGGWNGNAGAGAAYGAAFGLVAGAARKKSAQNEDQRRRNEYDAAFEDCMRYHQAQAQPVTRPPNPYATPKPTYYPSSAATPQPYAPAQPPNAPTPPQQLPSPTAERQG